MSNEADRAARAAEERTRRRGQVPADRQVPEALYELIEVLHSIGDSLAATAARR